MSIRHAIAAIAATAALVALPGCASLQSGASASEPVGDSAISSAVKSQLTADKTVDAAAIRVETFNGTVMLSGYAKTAAEKAAAEAIARGVKGVTSVDNRIAMRR